MLKDLSTRLLVICDIWIRTKYILELIEFVHVQEMERLAKTMSQIRVNDGLSPLRYAISEGAGRAETVNKQPRDETVTSHGGGSYGYNVANETIQACSSSQKNSY